MVLRGRSKENKACRFLRRDARYLASWILGVLGMIWSRKNLEGFEQVSIIFEAHNVENYPQNGPFWGSKIGHFEACLLTEIALKKFSVDEKFYFLILFVGLTLLFKMSPKTSESVHGAQSGTPKR